MISLFVRCLWSMYCNLFLSIPLKINLDEIGPGLTAPYTFGFDSTKLFLQFTYFENKLGCFQLTNIFGLLTH
jgi:hypothetical protein